MRNPISLFELNESLINDPSKIGVCFGISSNQDKYKFAIYLGNKQALVLYERGRGVDKNVFDRLGSMKTLDKKLLTTDGEIGKSLTNLEHLPIEALYDVYFMNVFEIKECTLKALFDTIKHNLTQLETLEEGDVIKFERTLYSHQGLLTDLSRMIVTHRSGEPENPGGISVSSNSILGIPTAKAEVTEDFIIEVAGYRKLTKANNLYDSLLLPRSKEEIVREAKRRIGEKGYSVRTRNCHHFVSECRNGTAYSPEVRDVEFGAKVFGTVLFAGLGLLTASSFISSRRQNNRAQEERNN